MPKSLEGAPRSVRLACSTVCFRRTSIDVALDEIRALNFDTIDLAVIPGFCPDFDATESTGRERDDFVWLVRNSGLSVGTITVVPEHFNVPGIGAEFVVQAAVTNLKLAALLNARGLNVTGALPIDADAGFLDNALAVAAGLKRLAKEAARLELNLNIEVPHPNGLCRTLDEAEFLLDRISERNAHILLALGQPHDGYAERAVRRFADRVGHVQLRDASGGKTAPGGDNDGPSLRPFFTALRQSDFHGCCALEVDCGDNLEQAREKLRRTRQLVCTQSEGLVDAPEDRRWNERSLPVAKNRPQVA
jgi:sugar phosphate isomerase/epimerase